MKKILCMLLACVFCVSTLGGCRINAEINELFREVPPSIRQDIINQAEYIEKYLREADDSDNYNFHLIDVDRFEEYTQLCFYRNENAYLSFTFRDSDKYVQAAEFFEYSDKAEEPYVSVVSSLLDYRDFSISEKKSEKVLSACKNQKEYSSSLEGDFEGSSVSVGCQDKMISFTIWNS